MRKVMQALAIAYALFAVIGPAQAGIPIPCTGDTIVKVLDLDTADIAAAQSAKSGKPAKKIDLGYKFSGCTGGEWVGYIGDSRRYLPLPEETLKLLLAKSGRSEFPPVPSFMGTIAASWVVWLYIVLFVPVLIAGIFGKKPNSTATESSVSPPVTTPTPASGLIGSARAASPAPIASATRPVIHAPVGPNVAAASARSARMTPRGGPIHAHASGTATFGRRG